MLSSAHVFIFEIMNAWVLDVKNVKNSQYFIFKNNNYVNEHTNTIIAGWNKND